MISRLLVIPLLSLGFSLSVTSAIAAISAPKALALVRQPNLEQDSQKQDSQPQTFSNGAEQQVFLGVLAICLLGTPVLGCSIYKQHLSYCKVVQRNKVESLERIWKLPSKTR